MSRFRPSLSRPPAPALAPRGVELLARPPAPPAVAVRTPAAASAAAIPAAYGRINPITVLLGAYILMYMVPVAEILRSFSGAHIPVVVITGAILTLALPFTGHLGRFWKAPVAKPWMTLLALIVVAAFLGNYPRGSVPFMLEYGVRFHLLPFYSCAIAVSTRRVQYLLYWGAGGAILLLALCAGYGTMTEGRLVLPETSLGNPNDLAFALLFAMTCLLMLVYTRSVLCRVLWLVSFPISVYYILMTGSRANFVTLLILAAAAFLLSSGHVKFAMTAAIPLAAAVVLAFIPSSTMQRLTLIVADPTEASLSTIDPELRGAIGSQAARTELQKRAVDLTLHHPVFGVGANMFADAVDSLVRAETGRKSAWQGAHNTYLEIAAENGIPAVIFYILSLVWCYRMNYRSWRTCQWEPSLRHAVPQALCLILMTLAFGIGVLFSNSAYDPRVDVLVALSAANFLAVQREAQIAKDLAPVPVAR